MKSQFFNKLLLARFPNLTAKYLHEISWQEGDSTGSHVVYGDVLTPYLVECITSGNIQETEKIFAFLEEILSLKDEYSENVIACSVIESITLLLMKRDNFQMLLGDSSRTIFEEFKRETRDDSMP